MENNTRRTHATRQYVTREEIAAALARFELSGGSIKCLPQQNMHSQMMIGGEKHNAYEPLSTFATLG